VNVDRANDTRLCAAEGAGPVCLTTRARMTLIPDDNGAFRPCNWIERFSSKPNHSRCTATPHDHRPVNVLPCLCFASANFCKQ
jgi:hypothetical protein